MASVADMDGQHPERKRDLGEPAEPRKAKAFLQYRSQLLALEML